MLRFEWDEAKNGTNRKKHGIWFEEAITVFEDPFQRFFLDCDHSDHEDRYVTIGFSSMNRLLVVVHCFNEVLETVRVISARIAIKRERAFYEKGI